MTLRNKPHVIMVYCGCHGVSFEDRQVLLLNSDDKTEATFRIEEFIRKIVEDPFTEGRVFSIFDCCRTGVEKNQVLLEALLGRNSEGEAPVKSE